MSSFEQEKYRILFERSADATFIVKDGKLIDCNAAAVEMFQLNSIKDTGMIRPSDLSPDHQPDGMPSRQKADQMIEIALQKGSNRFEWEHRRTDGTVFPVEVLLTRIPEEDGDVLYAVCRDITTRKKAEAVLKEHQHELESLVKKRTAELEKANRELWDALNHVKTLKGLLPICARCKNIRDDKGFWYRVEVYIETHSDALISHGLCPGCIEQLYGHQEWYKKKSEQKRNSAKHKT